MIARIYKKTTNEVTVGDKITEEFESDQGVRQGCALSAFLFDIMMDDLEMEMIKRKVSGTVIEKTKIFCLKYADDAAVVAEDEKSLKQMIELTIKWATENEMEINAKKTKIMVLRKGGKPKETSLKLGENELEVVKSFTCLGFYFTTGNSMAKQLEELAGKTVKATNSTWGLIRKEKKNRLKNRAYLMNSLVMSVPMYGVEVWGWFEVMRIERAYSKMVKMTIGVERNTPRYVWRSEMRIKSCRYESRARAITYLQDIVRMGEDRWPGICLREEMRGILNKNSTVWRRKVQEVLREIGWEEVVRLIYENKEPEEINKRLEEGLMRMAKNKKEADNKAIRASSYNAMYRDIVLDEEEEYYWMKEKRGSSYTEVWSRVRCGNLGRALKKGKNE
ncbi:uncharacterized protein LOC130671937 [Microplitis mediator]|uniref:uncharacterized protein LOC130671937 n=1 Tax=Microplitis mediator TaxID=375433 RepID=UPI0025526480|nr:uncharacterized protein LOC130671937 [Microplitis mediator]